MIFIFIVFVINGLKEVINNFLKNRIIIINIKIEMLIVIYLLIFCIVKIFLNKIWNKLVELFVIFIRIIFSVKKELKVILIVVFFFIILLFFIKVIMIEVNRLNIIVLIKKLMFKI